MTKKKKNNNKNDSGHVCPKHSTRTILYYDVSTCETDIIMIIWRNVSARGIFVYVYSKSVCGTGDEY